MVLGPRHPGRRCSGGVASRGRARGVRARAAQPGGDGGRSVGGARLHVLLVGRPLSTHPRGPVPLRTGSGRGGAAVDDARARWPPRGAAGSVGVDGRRREEAVEGVRQRKRWGSGRKCQSHQARQERLQRGLLVVVLRYIFIQEEEGCRRPTALVRGRGGARAAADDRSAGPRATLHFRSVRGRWWRWREPGHGGCERGHELCPCRR